MIKWTPDAEKRLAKAWNAGVTASACAERFGTSAGAIVMKIMELRRRGVDLRSRKGRRIDVGQSRTL